MIIAAYQAAETIADAVESALGQTYEAAEVIVCDDGSSDDFGAALAPYDDRVVLLRQENRGAASARNTAVRAATGDFVAILDADDVYCPERLEALAALAQARPDLDLVTTDAFFVVEGRRVGRFYEANEFETGDQRAAILRWCFVGGWPAIRRERLLEIGGFDPTLARSFDWDCWMRLIFGGARAGLVDEPLMEYRLGVGALSAQRAASLESRVTVLRKNANRLGLTKEERGILSGSLRLHGSRAIVARTLLEIECCDRREARQRMLGLVRDRALPAKLRMRAAAAYLQPSRVTRWLGEGKPLVARLGQRR